MLYKIWALACWLCAGIFASVALYSLIKRNPVSIWYRYDINPEKLYNPRGYNIANSIVWLVYALMFAVAGLISRLGNIENSLKFVTFLIIPGIPMVNISQRYIFKYHIRTAFEREEERKSQKGEQEAETSKDTGEPLPPDEPVPETEELPYEELFNEDIPVEFVPSPAAVEESSQEEPVPEDPAQDALAYDVHAQDMPAEDISSEDIPLKEKIDSEETAEATLSV
ncbi:MAG: hypothetical protein GX633_00580 [Clostridiales bacterium]|nr:hypothetical protein [Clostridiales bacterium]